MVKSDHNSILLIPAYKQKHKQEVPVMHSIRKWFDEADAKLQDYFASTDMFRGTPSVTSFINNCINDVVPTMTIVYVHIPTRNHGLQATSALS